MGWEPAPSVTAATSEGVPAEWSLPVTVVSAPVADEPVSPANAGDAVTTTNSAIANAPPMAHRAMCALTPSFRRVARAAGIVRTNPPPRVTTLGE